MNSEDDAADGAYAQLCGDGGDSVGYPGAETGMAGLMDGEIVCAGCEEGCGWVEGAVVEEGVDGDGEEGCE